MDVPGIIFIVLAIIFVGVVFGIAVARFSHMGHRMGEGMFKSSEYNLDDQDEFSDKNYYDENALK